MCQHVKCHFSKGTLSLDANVETTNPKHVLKLQKYLVGLAFPKMYQCLVFDYFFKAFYQCPNVETCYFQASILSTSLNNSPSSFLYAFNVM
jgi:hypothetical protein